MGLEGHIRWAYFGVSSISFDQCSGVLVRLTYIHCKLELQPISKFLRIKWR